ncbi:MAG: NfeD family protein [Bacteroides sp.]|nr:NfeD family protein [Bacteroides sp.]MCM1414191.1 NfeD family protein [Bacteroides sp.]MCM1472013.1 NfeD family protein [Bacteroides sp.]
MEPYLIWLIIFAVLIIIEVCSQMIWALCLATGALAAFVCSLLRLNLNWQLTALLIIAIAAYLILLPWVRRRNIEASKTAARQTGMDAIIGRTAYITHEVKPGRLGRARIDGDNWQVRAPHHSECIRVGEEVQVTDYDGIILTVKKIND